MEYIQVKDSDNVVHGVYTNHPGVVAGCTVYNENYTGPIDWATEGVSVVRSGEDSYA